MIWNSKVPVHHLSANWNKNETSFVGTTDRAFTWQSVFGNWNQPIHIHSCSSPDTTRIFLLCLALDSAPTWSISNSGPALTVVSLLVGIWMKESEALCSRVISGPCLHPCQASLGLTLELHLPLAVLDSVSFGKFLAKGSSLAVFCQRGAVQRCQQALASLAPLLVSVYAVLPFGSAFVWLKFRSVRRKNTPAARTLTLSCLWGLVCSECSSWASIMLCFLFFTGRLEPIYLNCSCLVLECAMNILCAV